MRRPEDYDRCWSGLVSPRAWYETAHESQRDTNTLFEAWYRERASDIGSVLEIGCGAGVRYPTLFHDKRYVGVDVSQPAIDECLKRTTNPLHDFVCGEFGTAAPSTEHFDLVFSHAVLDHVYDVDLFLEASVRASAHWLYHTAYSGWFPEEREHTYRWSDVDGCYYNRLSPDAAVEQLTALGCVDAACQSSRAGSDGASWSRTGTLITAKVGGR
jgi:SAM-dependent methyltransferase